MSENGFSKVGLGDLHRRYIDHLAQSYLEMGFLVKGAVLTVAAISVIAVFSNLQGKELWVHVLFLVSAIFTALIPLATYRRGVLLAGVRLSLVDYLAPLGMGGAEIMMFIVLDPERPTQADFREFWFLAAALHAFFAIVLVTVRLNFSKARDFSSEVNDSGIIRRYRGWLQIDRLGALVTSAFATFMCMRGAELNGGKPFFNIGSLPVDALNLAAVVIGLIALLVSAQATRQHQLIGRTFEATG